MERNKNDYGINYKLIIFEFLFFLSLFVEVIFNMLKKNCNLLYWIANSLLIVGFLVIFIIFGKKLINVDTDNKTFTISDKNSKILMLVFLCISLVTKLMDINGTPNYLNVDEASMIYDSYLIGKFGIDRNGYWLPIYLKAWGSGQNALLSYLSIPFVLLFGMNRFSSSIVMILMSVIASYCFYSTILKISKNNVLSLIALICLSFCPWYFIASRYGLESNLLIFCFIIAVYFLVRSLDDKPWFFLLAGLFFGLCLYCYALSFIVLPIFLLLVYIYMFINKKVVWLPFILGNIILFVFALPLILFVLINMGVMEPIYSFITIPKLTVFRSSEIDFKFLDNLRIFIIRIVFQDDKMPWNVLTPYGVALLCSLPLFLLGIYKSLSRLFKDFKNKKFSYEFIPFATFISTFILAILVKFESINKDNLFWLVYIYYLVMGLYEILKNNKLLFKIITISMTFKLCLFGFNYFTNNKVNNCYSNGMIECTIYATALSDKDIYVTNTGWSNYIYVMVGAKLDSYELKNTLKIKEGTENSKIMDILSFGRYNFLDFSDKTIIDNNCVYIVTIEEANTYFDDTWSKKTYDKFCVLIKNNEG
jgi:4-amino-4-deoxy-L-arabinose transferase-like glycosyltransferase